MSDAITPIFPKKSLSFGGMTANASRVPPRSRLGRAALSGAILGDSRLTSSSLDPSTLGGWANSCAGTLKHGDISQILRATPV